MSKQIAIEVVGSGVKAIADLQEEDAPHVCAELWKALGEKSIEEKTIHASTAGQEVYMHLTKENQYFEGPSIPVENATAYPVPGDIAWGYFPAHMERAQKEGIWNLAFVYGQATFTSSLGIRPISVFACITEGLKEFADECIKIRMSDGPKVLRISRVDTETS